MTSAVVGEPGVMEIENGRLLPTGPDIPVDDLERVDLVDLPLDDDFRIVRVVDEVVETVHESLGHVALGHGVGVLAAVDVQRDDIPGAHLAAELDFPGSVAPDSQRRVRVDRQGVIGVDDVRDLVPHVQGGLALLGGVEQLVPVDRDLDLLPAREHGGELGLIEFGVGDIDGKLLVELEVPAAVYADRGGVADALARDHGEAPREDEDAPREGVRDVDVLPVVGQGCGRADAARAFRFGQLHEVGLPDDEIGGRAVPGREGSVDEDAVVAGVRHE